MTKPRAGWTIALGGASARRQDGVTAGFFFASSNQPYGVERPYQSPRRGQVREALRRAGAITPRRFSSLEKAMEAADRQWPIT